MKKILNILLTVFITASLVACSNKNDLPLPEVSDGLRGELGIDKNINEDTIDNYLGRSDSVYRDMRMLIDEADYGAIGGDSHLSGFVKGFEVVPYPYLCNVEGLPEEVGSTYSGDTLFSHVDDEYISNYRESMSILESLFPKDKNIFLMCGGGGYAGMTKKLLVSLGWDEDKIYNVGGYWYYKGNNNVEVKYEENGETLYNFAIVNYHDINFDTLTPINEKIDKDNIDSAVEKSDFIKINNIEELNELENGKKTFPLFIFLSGCPTCAEFLPVVKEYSTNKGIQMYSLDLNDVWGSDNSVTDRIKYAPSMFIYKDGEVIAYLNSSNDEDKQYYKSSDKLSDWFDTHINIELFDKIQSNIGNQ